MKKLLDMEAFPQEWVMLMIEIHDITFCLVP